MEKQRLGSAIQDMRQGIILVDREGRIVQTNPRGDDLLSIIEKQEKGEILESIGGRSLPEILHFTRSGKILEVTALTKPSRFVRISASVFGKGLPKDRAGVVLLLEDCTAERQSLQKAQEQDRLAGIGQLAAGIAHDFNNILTAIIGLAQLAEMDPGVQVVIMSGYAPSQELEELKITRSIKDFIQKPFSIEQLASMIQRGLKG